MLKLLNKLLNKKRLPKNFEIIKPYYIEFVENLQIDEKVYIGPHAFWSLKGGMKIGKNVIIGPKSTIWTYNHNIHSHDSIPYGGEDILKPVTIKDHVWIGINVTILPGTLIEEGAVISAGSVVRGTVKACEIMAGNPAKVVGTRNKDVFYDAIDSKRFYLYQK